MTDSEINKALREANRALSKVAEILDAIDYESVGLNRVDQAMNKAYQSLFATGDCINEARAAIIYRRYDAGFDDERV